MGRQRSSAVLERNFQREIRDELEHLFPGCVILKNDPNLVQGVPDLLILYRNRWAALEVKASSNAHHQPNQEYYIEKMSGMSYAAFIFPENKPSVFSDLEDVFFHPYNV